VNQQLLLKRAVIKALYPRETKTFVGQAEERGYWIRITTLDGAQFYVPKHLVMIAVDKGGNI